MMTTQYTDAILIIRVEADGTRRVVGSAHSQAIADRSCIMLTRELYNYNSGREYITKRNPKYQFDDALQVVGLSDPVLEYCRTRRRDPETGYPTLADA